MMLEVSRPFYTNRELYESGWNATFVTFTVGNFAQGGNDAPDAPERHEDGASETLPVTVICFCLYLHSPVKFCQLELHLITTNFLRLPPARRSGAPDVHLYSRALLGSHLDTVHTLYISRLPFETSASGPSFEHQYPAFVLNTFWHSDDVIEGDIPRPHENLSLASHQARPA